METILKKFVDCSCFYGKPVFSLREIKKWLEPAFEESNFWPCECYLAELSFKPHDGYSLDLNFNGNVFVVFEGMIFGEKYAAVYEPFSYQLLICRKEFVEVRSRTLDKRQYFFLGKNEAEGLSYRRSFELRRSWLPWKGVSLAVLTDEYRDKADWWIIRTPMSLDAGMLTRINKKD